MKHALLVEDLPETRDWLTAVLAEAFPGILVHAGATVAEGLALVACGNYDLALVDLALPDGNGLEVVAQLAGRQAHTVIVVVTIFDDDGHLFPALQAGAQGYLLKDQPAPQVIRQLRSIVDGLPPLSPPIARRLLGHFRKTDENSGTVTLTPREREVLAHLAQGVKIADIAALLGISPHTAGDHVKNIYRKLNISSRAQAATAAARLGLLS